MPLLLVLGCGRVGARVGEVTPMRDVVKGLVLEELGGLGSTGGLGIEVNLSVDVAVLAGAGLGVGVAIAGGDKEWDSGVIVVTPSTIMIFEDMVKPCVVPLMIIISEAIVDGESVGCSAVTGSTIQTVLFAVNVGCDDSPLGGCHIAVPGSCGCTVHIDMLGNGGY